MLPSAFLKGWRYLGRDSVGAKATLILVTNTADRLARNWGVDPAGGRVHPRLSTRL